jgi:hypothetical protein
MIRQQRLKIQKMQIMFSPGSRAWYNKFILNGIKRIKIWKGGFTGNLASFAFAKRITGKMNRHGNQYCRKSR